MKLALLGRTEFLLDAGRELQERGHSVDAVFTGQSESHYAADASEFESFAMSCGARFRGDGQVDDEDLAYVAAGGIQMGISVNWPRMLGGSVLSAFPFGVLNGHAGDLPRYRGNACLNWAILNGEPRVAAVVHGMRSDGVDVGPIYARRRRVLRNEDYIGDLYRWLRETLPLLFCEVVDSVSTTQSLPVALTPGPGPGLRCYPRRPGDSQIQWTDSAEDIARLVRASSHPFPGAITTLDGREFRVWRAAPVDAARIGTYCAMPGQVLAQDGQGLLIACGVGVIRIENWSAQAVPLKFTSAIRLGT